MFQGHTAVLLIGNQKRCHYCYITNTKTKNGWDIFTRFKCSQCNIPLCPGRHTNRNCFNLFHTYVSQDSSYLNTLNELKIRMAIEHPSSITHDWSRSNTLHPSLLESVAMWSAVGYRRSRRSVLNKSIWGLDLAAIYQTSFQTIFRENLFVYFLFYSLIAFNVDYKCLWRLFVMSILKCIFCTLLLNENLTFLYHGDCI